jgi:hypothetical protein
VTYILQDDGKEGEDDAGSLEEIVRASEMLARSLDQGNKKGTVSLSSKGVSPLLEFLKNSGKVPLNLTCKLDNLSRHLVG